MVSLEIVEKLFWTNYDFLISRPREFHKTRLEQPSRYMEPVTFAVTMYIINQLVFFGIFKILSFYVDWDTYFGVKLKVPNLPEYGSYIAIIGPLALFLFCTEVCMLALAARAVKLHVKIRDILIASCYACASLSLSIIYLGIATFVIATVGITGGNVISIIKNFQYCFEILSYFLSLYFISSAAAYCRINFWRLLIGYLIIFSVILTTFIFVL